MAIKDLTTITPKSSFGFFSRDTATASGNLSITGVGFRPKAIEIAWAINNTNCQGSSLSVISGSPYNTGQSRTSGSTVYVYTDTSVIDAYPSGGSCAATIASWDSDGFTLSFTKTSNPTGTILAYYKCFA